jgi:hypothetical protein
MWSKKQEIKKILVISPTKTMQKYPEKTLSLGFI